MSQRIAPSEQKAQELRAMLAGQSEARNGGEVRSALVPIRITLTPVALPRSANPLLGCAFAAPFSKGGRQTWNGWRGEFSAWTLADGIIRIGS
jgi:hypothetical protein